MWSKIKEIVKEYSKKPLVYAFISVLGFAIGLNIVGILSTGIFLGHYLFKNNECKHKED